MPLHGQSDPSISPLQSPLSPPTIVADDTQAQPAASTPAARADAADGPLQPALSGTATVTVTVPAATAVPAAAPEAGAEDGSKRTSAEPQSPLTDTRPLTNTQTVTNAAPVPTRDEFADTRALTDTLPVTQTNATTTAVTPTVPITPVLPADNPNPSLANPPPIATPVNQPSPTTPAATLTPAPTPLGAPVPPTDSVQDPLAALFRVETMILLLLCLIGLSVNFLGVGALVIALLYMRTQNSRVRETRPNDRLRPIYHRPPRRIESERGRSSGYLSGWSETGRQ